MDENKKIASNPEEQVEMKPVREDETIEKEKKPEANEAQEKKEKKARNMNIIFTAIQILLIVVCVVISIVVIVSPPSTKQYEKPEEISVRMTRVISDSMAPTFNVNEIISGKRVSADVTSGKEILDVTTVVTFASARYGFDQEKQENVTYYVPITHRIIGYQYYLNSDEDKVARYWYYQGGIKSFDELNSDHDKTFMAYITCGDHYNVAAHQYGNLSVSGDIDSGISKATGTQLYKFENGNYVKLEYSTMADLNNDYRIYNFEEVVLGEETYHVLTSTENTSYSARRGELTYAKDIVGIITSEKGNAFIGNVVGWLTDEIWHFIVLVVVPLLLLFGYNVYLVIRIIVEEKQKKAVEEAKQEVLANQEELKKQAIAEYLASLKKNEEETKEE